MRMYQKFDSNYYCEGVEPQRHPLVSEISRARRLYRQPMAQVFSCSYCKTASRLKREKSPGYTEHLRLLAEAAYRITETTGILTERVIPWIAAIGTRATGWLTLPSIRISSHTRCSSRSAAAGTATN